MPFVTVDAARLLLGAVGTEDVCCFVRDGSPEPLLAIYRSALGQKWRPLLAQNPSLRSLLREVSLRTLEASDARVLDSINTPEQLAAVKS